MSGDLPLRATIQFLNSELSSAFARRDFAGVAAAYSDDAVLLPQEVTIVAGRDNIRAFWRRFQANRISFETVGMRSLTDDTVREVGQLHFGEERGNAGQPRFRYLTIWRKTDDQWEITTCMWNRAAPPQLTREEQAVVTNAKGQPIPYVPRVK